MKLTHMILCLAATAAAFGQLQGPSEITVGGVHIKGVPTDWSHRHVIFSNPGTEAEAIKNGTHDRWLKIVNDPRYVIQQLQRQQPGQGLAGAEVARLLTAEPPAAGDGSPDKKRRKHRDWSMDLGVGSIPANTFPAKWSFDTTTANCASDFVVFPTGTAGSPSQATIVAYNNLYAGCGGTVPGVYWQYNANSIGSDLSPVLSADGTQVAFMSHNLGGGSVVPDVGGGSLVILKWAANSSLVPLNPISVAAYRNCTAPCATMLSFSSADGNSSPFYDYANDAIYVGNSNGVLYKFTGVFNGTPAAAASPWPVNVAPGTALTSPVLEPVSGLVMVGSLNGRLYSVSSSTGAVAGTSSQLDAVNGIYDAPLVDSSAAMVYAFAGYDGNSGCSDGLGHTGCSGVFQFPVGFSSGAGTETQVGLGYLPLFSGAFDNAYYTSNSSSPTGNLYVCGQTDTNAQQTLNQIPIAANVMGAQTAGSYLVGNGADCSPVTEFYNTSVSTDYLFLSSEAAYQGCTQNAGCLFGFNVTSGTAPDNAEFDTQAGGTSGIVVDNSVGSGTLAGASQIYFTTLSNTATCATSGGTGICGVQDSQTSLYVDWSEFHNTLDHQGFNQYENVLSPSTVGSLGVNWSYTTGYYVYSSSPAVANGVVYVGSQDDNVYALNASTGAKLWSYTTGGQVDSSPAVANGVVYVGSTDDRFYALNASTGALLWSYATGSSVFSSPAVANGVVYVGSGDYKVYALNAITGALVWSYTTGGDVDSSPAVANGVVYIGSLDDKVYALNASTGALLWSYTTGNEVYDSPVVANGVVYVGSNDDKVYAFALP